MSLVVNPESAAAETAALLTEWALNTPVSMPALDSIDFSQRATVDEDTGLNGCMVAMRSCDSFSDLFD